MNELKNIIDQSAPKAENSIEQVDVKFNPEIATLLLNINKALLDLEQKQSEAKQFELSKKEEFHFTIIGSNTGKEILESLSKLDESEQKVQLEKIRKLSKSINWQVVLKNDYYFVQKEYDENELRKSIVQMAEIEGLEEFYQQLNSLFGKQFKTPLPHLTLYTTSTKEDKKLRGIGIYSKDQFEELNPKKI